MPVNTHHTSARDEREIFGSGDAFRAYWRRCCDLAIEEAIANGTLGKLSWPEWIALCVKQKPKADSEL